MLKVVLNMSSLRMMNSIKKILFNELKLLRGLEISYPTFRCRGGHLPRIILGTPGLALRGACLIPSWYLLTSFLSSLHHLPLHFNARLHTVFEREIL